MMEENQLEVSKAHFDEYLEIVNLFNKNKVYQFPDGRPLNTEDFDLAMKVKEVQPFFFIAPKRKINWNVSFLQIHYT